MKLFEYQVKEIFKQYDIPIPDGFVMDLNKKHNIEDIQYPTMIKSQLLIGSRYKKGAIKSANNNAEFTNHINNLKETNFSGKKVENVLIEKKIDIKEEHFIGITYDANKSCPVLLASKEGGINVEDHNIIKVSINILIGIKNYHIETILDYLEVNKNRSEYGKIIKNLYNIYRDYDANLVEINPLIIMSDDKGIMALDGKMTINENSLYRQNFKIDKSHFDNELEYKAAKNNLNYVKLNGNIGVLCTGAGLTLATIDLIHHYGGKAANFLEFGGATYKKASIALEIALGNPNVEVLLINTFGLVARADIIAEGLVKALEKIKPEVPIIVSIKGTGQSEAKKILDKYNLESYPNIEKSVQAAVELV